MMCGAITEVWLTSYGHRWTLCGASMSHSIYLHTYYLQMACLRDRLSPSLCQRVSHCTPLHLYPADPSIYQWPLKE